MQFDMIADLVYKKDEKKVVFVMAQETDNFFVVYSVDSSFVPKPIPEEVKYSLSDIYEPTKEEKERIDRESYIEAGNPIMIDDNIAPFIRHIHELKISIVENDIHILINESTDKQKLSYNKTDGWKLLEE